MLEDLANPFKEKIELLISKIEQEKLPMRLFETRRSFKRSSELYAKGRVFVDGLLVVHNSKEVVSNAKAGESPHNWGLAADFVLVGNKPWNTDAESMKVWHAFGKVVGELDLEWGGNWKFRDLPHVELKGWRKLRPSNWRSIVEREMLKCL